MLGTAILIAAASADPVAGTWEGTSLCQVRPSPCHDEHVIYRISRTGGGGYRIDAYKVVAGSEQFMGPIQMRLDSAGRALSGSNRDRAGVLHPWIFTIAGTHMSGRALDGPRGRVFRLIQLTKR